MNEWACYYTVQDITQHNTQCAEIPIKAGYLLPKITGYGLHVSIDPRAIPAMLQELGMS